VRASPERAPEGAAKLDAIKNRATRYELVLTNLDSGEKRRLCYTSKKNRTGLFAAIRSNGTELVAFSGSEDFKLEGKASASIGRWSVAFSGRTQREAIIAGELAGSPARSSGTFRAMLSSKVS
jgi:hypothetical protein